MKKAQPEFVYRSIRTLWLIALLVFSLLSPPAIAEQQGAEPEYWYHVEIISFTRYVSSDVQESWNAQAVGPLSIMEPIEPTPGSRYAIELAKDNLKLVPEAYTINRKNGYRIQSHQAWKVGGMPKEQAPWLNLKTDSEKLTGQVRIFLSTYLHANIDASLENPNDLNTRVPFTSNRRMKLDELHYIDHPMAGMLIKIERFGTQE
jgi:hypothetical protein